MCKVLVALKAHDTIKEDVPCTPSTIPSCIRREISARRGRIVDGNSHESHAS